MKTKIILLHIIGLFLLSACCCREEKEPLSLYYTRPATDWYEALPVGNGHLGAMVYGKTDDELLQLNDNTLYSGEPSTAYKGLDITETYDGVVAMLRSEKYAEATDFLLKNWMCKLHQNYQPLGDWHLKNNMAGEITGYKRELDIANAVLSVSYRQNGAGYTREVFASHPDDVIVIRLKSDRAGALDITTSLSSVHPTATQKTSSDGWVSMSGQAPGYVERRTLEQLENWGFQSKHPELFHPDGSRKFDKQILYGDEIDGRGTFFETRVKAIAREAKMTANDQGLRIFDTDEIILVLSSATSFNGFDKSPSREGVDAAKIAEETLRKVEGLKYEKLKTRHVDDYRSLFGRVSFEMPATPEQAALPTDERICRNTETPDNGLVPLVFQYGRYLMISGSRPGGQPLNLQGIWNDQVIPPWNGAYTININTEMNYWPAELTNLAECQQPLFQMIREIAVTGAETAAGMYRRKGWMGHHNVSIWRETWPNDGHPTASYWPMVSPWLCSHFWEHYLFSGDSLFLRNEAYPLMKGAAEFYVDWLVDNGEGFPVTPVSTSPENTFYTKEGKTASVSMGVTMDMAMIRELFTRTAEVSEQLNVDPEFRKVLQEKLSKLLPYRIGAKGQLQEWQQDFEEPEPTHRHLSHLYSIHPGNQITYDHTPELFNAVRRTMEIRKEGGGWSGAWRINIWARLLDGERAGHFVNVLLAPSFCKNGERGSLHPNLWESGSYQIDANFGFTAGVTEMLLQSHAGFVQLLPALSPAWPSGKITGLKARGGFTADIEWENGQLTKARITSALGGNCRLRTARPVSVKNVQTKEAQGQNPNPLFGIIDPGKPQNLSGATLETLPVKSCHTVDFMTEKGKTYEIEIR
ncbi:MAG: glycoside hydrolase family 95 protein [Tannerella sp.]|jgi:alpha-L-fucosidase 2|nr:glycoside hydrolase family 95 protein [Tannerella sp.]